MWKDSLGQFMRIHGYSNRTIDSYTDALSRITKYYHKNPDDVSENDLRKFLDIQAKAGKSPYTLNQYHVALKFFQTKIINKEWKSKLGYAKRHIKIPTVLSNEEVYRIVHEITNHKHRIMILLAYGAGLRVSELINLRVQDLDLEADKIVVRGGKGNKDRITILPEKLVDNIRNIKAGKNLIDYVFESERGGKLTARTIQRVFSRAIAKSGVSKKASFHSLRHSFATQLLEKGVDIRYIQMLLGHASVATTQIYTKVSQVNLLNIKSPL